MSLKDEVNDIHAENRLANKRATAEQEAARQQTSLQYERDKVRWLANFIARIPDRLREAAKTDKHSLVVSRIADEFDVPQGWGIRRAEFDEWANKASFHHSNYGIRDPEQHLSGCALADWHELKSLGVTPSLYLNGIQQIWRWASAAGATSMVS